MSDSDELSPPRGYGPTSYGEAFADVYDDWYERVSDVGATVARVRALAGGGPVLELGVGTGRLALPLADAGVETWGVDASGAMLAHLRAKPGAERVRVVQADMAAPALVADGRFAVVFCAYNTFFNLHLPDDQASCLAWSTTALAPEGRLAIEAFVPSEGASTPEGPVSVRSIEPDRVVLSVAERDVGGADRDGPVRGPERGRRAPAPLPHPLSVPGPAGRSGRRGRAATRRPVGRVGRRAVHGRQPQPRVDLRGGMNELRWNPLAGQWVTIATERAARPSDFAPRFLPVEAEPDRPCPFCPGHEDDFPPALESYARDGEWLVRVVPNKYPAFRGVEHLDLTVLGPVFTQAPASGIHEVLVLSPDHQRAWADLDDRQVALVMAAIRDRVEDHGRHAVVRHSLVIVNHGREAGASLEHPHGQLLGTPFVSRRGGRRGHGLRRVRRRVPAVLDRRGGAARRATGWWTTTGRPWCSAPTGRARPTSCWSLPTTHQGDVTRSDPPDVVGVGRAVRDGLRRVRALLGDVPYNLVLHTAPRGDDGPYHWHVHVVPRVTSVAGFEQGTGALINIVAPELAAQQLVRQDPGGGLGGDGEVLVDAAGAARLVAGRGPGVQAVGQRAGPVTQALRCAVGMEDRGAVAALEPVVTLVASHGESLRRGCDRNR